MASRSLSGSDAVPVVLSHRFFRIMSPKKAFRRARPTFPVYGRGSAGNRKSLSCGVKKALPCARTGSSARG